MLRSAIGTVVVFRVYLFDGYLSASSNDITAQEKVGTGNTVER